MQANNTKQNRSQNIDVLSIQIIPDLTVAVEEASAIDIDIISTELEECCGILEDLLESVCLPVVGVVGELNVALNVDVDVVEIGQVQCCTNHILLTFRENDMATVVALVNSGKNVVRVICNAIVVRADVADFVSGGRRREWLERLLGRDVSLWACPLMLRDTLWEMFGVFLLSRPCRRCNSCNGTQKSCN